MNYCILGMKTHEALLSRLTIWLLDIKRRGVPTLPRHPWSFPDEYASCGLLDTQRRCASLLRNLASVGRPRFCSPLMCATTAESR
jgi:hypothetical protein